MSTSLIDNFSYRGRAFLDSRQNIATLAVLKAVPETEVPDGFRAYCAEDGQWYEFKSSNTSDAVTGKWRKLTTEVAQETGDRTDIPMSQKAVTERLENLTAGCFIFAGTYEPSRVKYEHVLRNCIKKIYVAQSILPTDIVLTEEGLPKVGLRQLREYDGKMSVSLNYEKTGGEVVPLISATSKIDGFDGSLCSDDYSFQVELNLDTLRASGIGQDSVGQYYYSNKCDFIVNWPKVGAVLYPHTVREIISGTEGIISSKNISAGSVSTAKVSSTLRPLVYYTGSISGGFSREAQINAIIKALYFKTLPEDIAYDDEGNPEIYLSQIYYPAAANPRVRFSYRNSLGELTSLVQFNMNRGDGLIITENGNQILVDIDLFPKIVIPTDVQIYAADDKYRVNYNRCQEILHKDEILKIVSSAVSEKLAEPGVFPSVGNRQLQGYKLFTIGDSLSSGGKWQERVKECTGIEFSQELNSKAGASLSVGGTATFGNSLTCGYFRTRILVEQGYITGDGDDAVVIFENVNDNVQQFHGNERTYNIERIIDAGLASEFSSSILDSLPESDKSINTALILQEIFPGKVLTIDTLPTQEGDVKLYCGWAGPGVKLYNIHVVPQATEEETRQYILDKIAEISFTGVTCIKGDDGASLIFSAGLSNPEYTLNLQFYDNISSTGMTCSITDTNEARFSRVYVFGADDLSLWNDTTKWIPIPFSSAWKSSIELLQRTYPKIHIFIGIFPSIGVNQSDYLLDNGGYDQEAFNSSTMIENNEKNSKAKKDIASYYCLPVIDIMHECGIGINNFTTYYQETANVHPKDEGYNRWGDVVAARLISCLPPKY